MASRTRSLLRQVASLRADLEKNAKGEIPDFTRDLDFHRLASDLIAGCVDPAIMEETIGLWHLLAIDGDRAVGSLKKRSLTPSVSRPSTSKGIQRSAFPETRLPANSN